MVVRESEIEDLVPLRSAAMPSVGKSSTQDASDTTVLLDDDLLHPEYVALQTESIRHTDQYVKVSLAHCRVVETK